MIEAVNWTEIPKQPFHQTATRQVFTGKNVMLVLNTIEPGFPPFPHKHPHEQLLCILEGECEVTIGEEKTRMKAGDMIHVPPNVMHDLALIGNERVVNLDVFSPIREDYLPEK